MEASSLTQRILLQFLGYKIFLFLFSTSFCIAMKSFFYSDVRFLLCVVCVKCSCGAGSTSHAAQQEVHVIALKVFLVCGQFWLY